MHLFEKNQYLDNDFKNFRFEQRQIFDGNRKRIEEIAEMYVLGLDNSVSAGVQKRDQKQGDSMIQKEISF